MPAQCFHRVGIPRREYDAGMAARCQFPGDGRPAYRGVMHPIPNQVGQGSSEDIWQNVEIIVGLQSLSHH